MIQSSAHISREVTKSQLANITATAIFNSLTAAVGNYKRYFDLFSGTYYLNNPDKREISAKRYALLKTCNELSEKENCTISDVFEVYKGFDVASITNYKSFIRKLADFRRYGAATCTNKRINENYKDSYKLNSYVDYLIYTYLCDPAYHSYNSIKTWLNNSILDFNDKHGTEFSTISKSSVAQYYIKNRNEINYYRKGKQRFDTDTRPYLPRITAKNAGSLYQMDGTPVQIFCWNPEKNQKIRLNLFVIRDAYSGKITGFDMSETENRWNIISALKMSVNVHSHLPAELVSDNFSASKTDEYKAIKKFMADRGVVVRAAKVGNAQDKGEVERFFGTFQSRFQRLIDGYIGEGIRSKRDNGRISEEFITKCHKENGLYGYDEMMKIIAELVAIYNSSEINEKYGTKTPNQMYAESDKPFVKEINVLDYAQMFWLNKEVQVKKSMIINEVNKSKRYYEIWDNDLKLRLNGEKVRIFYEENDASDIYVFTLDGEFVCTCRQRTQIHEAFVDQLEGEGERIIRHVSHRNAFYTSVENKTNERQKKAEEFIGVGIELLTPITQEKRKLNNAESQALLKHFYAAKDINPNDIKERESVNTKEMPEKTKMKGIHIVPATYNPI